MSDSIEAPGGSRPTFDVPTLAGRGAGSVSTSPLQPLSFDRRYQATGKLGEGGMGEVKLVADRQVGRYVAFKVLHGRINEVSDQARFVREARIQGQLEHPSVVPVYDLGVDPEGRAYFTMRRVRGATLEEILSGLRAGDAQLAARYTRRRLLNAMLQVCLAVDYAHEQGVLHRDLKPANIMLGDFGEVYVLDWGLAKHVGDEEEPARPLVDAPTHDTLPGSSMGTPGYAAPEQIGGRGDEVGPPADVYALGAILFEVLSLVPLHPIGSLEQMISSTLRGAEARTSIRVPGANIAPELEFICVTATALRPGDRLPSARHLHDALDRYLGGERDVEMRVQLSRNHAQKAAEAANRCGDGSSSSLPRRREAMREIGRALALDPTNELAMQTLVRLMNAPPDVLPPEVEAELSRAESLRVGWVGRFAGLTYLSLFAYVPLLLWAGIRSPGPIVAFYGFVLLAAALSLWAGLAPAPSPKNAFVVMVCANLAYATSAAFYGPLVLAPGMVAVNTAAFSMLLTRRMRIAAVAAGCLSILVPVTLELAGVVRPSYAFGEGGMTILPHVLDTSPFPTWLVLTIASVAIVITGSVSAGYVKDTLRKAERHLYLYAWHIGELASMNPSSHGPGRDTPLQSEQTSSP